MLSLSLFLRASIRKDNLVTPKSTLPAPSRQNNYHNGPRDNGRDNGRARDGRDLRDVPRDLGRDSQRDTRISYSSYSQDNRSESNYPSNQSREERIYQDNQWESNSGDSATKRVRHDSHQPSDNYQRITRNFTEDDLVQSENQLLIDDNLQITLFNGFNKLLSGKKYKD